MAWFSKAVVRMKPNLDWIVKREDFLQDNLEGYPDLHTGTVLIDIMNLIPSRYHRRVFVAGGFAAFVAGITKEYRDIDLFCNTPSVFDKLLTMYQEDPTIEQVADLIELESYGRLWKFQKDGYKFDLVDIYPIAKGLTGTSLDVIDILSSFDINWAMAAITLVENPHIFIHPEALSGDPRVNVSYVKVLEGTQARIEKYMERLVRPVDVPYAKRVIKALGIHMANHHPVDWDS